VYGTLDKRHRVGYLDERFDCSFSAQTVNLAIRPTAALAHRHDFDEFLSTGINKVADNSGKIK